MRPSARPAGAMVLSAPSAGPPALPPRQGPVPGLVFVQLTWRESLRDLEAGLAAHPNKLYGMGFRRPVRRSTLADAMEQRDWRIWPDGPVSKKTVPQAIPKKISWGRGSLQEQYS